MTDFNFSDKPHIMPIITEIKVKNSDDKELDFNPEELPLLALRNMVLFPGITMPVAIGRKKSLNAITEAQKSHSPIGVICQIDEHVEDPEFDDLYKVGVIADIVKVLELPDGSTNVILQARGSFKLEKILYTTPYLAGAVSPYPEVKPKAKDREFTAILGAMRDTAIGMLQDLGDDGKEMLFAIKNIEDPIYLINFVCSNFPFDAEVKASLLETIDIKERAMALTSNLSKEAQLIKIKAEIQNKTREDLTQQQREHFLQQQIRTIQDELGDAGTDQDFDELRARAEEKNWDEATAAAFEKEMRKLERVHPQSPDYSVQYTYLDTLLNLPWGVYTEDNFDLKKVEDQLNKDHYGLENVKDRIIEHLAVLKLRKDMKAPIICLYGPPGVGKTSLGKSIADALNRKYVRVSLGGMHDEAEIRGHRRTYIGAMAGRILQGLTKAGTSNPVFVLDEIDKLGADFKGDPSSALLEVLDPEQNNHFHDNYIDIDYDLSKILFIATANSLATMPQPLLDRMEII